MTYSIASQEAVSSGKDFHVIYAVSIIPANFIPPDENTIYTRA